MKCVSILTSGHSPYDDRIFFKEARSLKKAGLDVRLISSTGNYDEVQEGIKIEGFRIDPFLIRIFAGRILKLVNFVKLAVRGKCGIYHCHEFGPLISAHIAKFIRLVSYGHKVRVIYDLHEWFPWDISWKPGNPFLKRIRYWVYQRLHSFLCNRTDYIIVTEKFKVPLFKSILIHSRVITIENFPPLELFAMSAKQFQREHFVIAYAGGLSKERGIYELARATQIFSQKNRAKPHLLLIGDFYSSTEKKKFLHSFRNTDFELEITGWIPHPQVPVLLGNADICAMLWQRTEKFIRSLPIKLYEYMALSKPVIASNFGETKRVIDKTGCGLLVDPSNVEATADAINFYFNNPKEMHRQGMNGRYWVEREFNWTKSEEKLLSIYSYLNSIRQKTQRNNVTRKKQFYLRKDCNSIS